MPRPASTVSTLRPDLGAIAFEYALAASQRGFIGLTVLPIFETGLQTGTYPKIPIEAMLKLQDTKRAERASYGRSDWNFEDGSYACSEDGWEEPIGDDERAKYEGIYSALDLESVAIMRATDILLRGGEKRVADMVFNATNFTVHEVTTEWSTAATAGPRSDVQTGCQAVRDNTGLDPDVLIINRTVFNNILVCAEFKDYTQYTTPVLLSTFEAQKSLVAQYLGVERILVGDAIYDSAKKNKAFSASKIWSSEYGMLAKLSSGGLDLKEPCLGRTMLWTADSPQVITTDQYREEQTRSDIYRVRQNTDEVFIFTGAGYLLGNLTA